MKLILLLLLFCLNETTRSQSQKDHFFFNNFCNFVDSIIERKKIVNYKYIFVYKEIKTKNLLKMYNSYSVLKGNEIKFLNSINTKIKNNKIKFNNELIYSELKGDSIREKIREDYFVIDKRFGEFLKEQSIEFYQLTPDSVNRLEAKFLSLEKNNDLKKIKYQSSVIIGIHPFIEAKNKYWCMISIAYATDAEWPYLLISYNKKTKKFKFYNSLRDYE